MAVKGIDLGKYQLGWHDSTDDYVYTPHKGLNVKTVHSGGTAVSPVTRSFVPAWITSRGMR